MKIIRLQAANVKRLRAVDITPGDGNVVVIGGENAQGKSSCLDSIAYALGGARLAPPEVVRRGESDARVEVDLGEMVVERRWHADSEHQKASTTLEVRSKAGSKLPSPQALLDKLHSKLSFDPLAFTRLKPEEKAEQLRKLVGLDFTEHDAERERVFAERTNVNRDAKTLEARVPVEEPGAAKEPVDVKVLMAELKALTDSNRERDRKAQDRAIAEQHVADLEVALDAARIRLAGCREACDRLPPAPLPGTETGLRSRIENATAINQAVERQRQRRKLVDELELLKDRSEAMTAKLAKMDAEKERAIAAAEFPVAGLGFDRNGVTLNGLPIEQASAAEQLKVSVAMGMALNPKLRVLLVRDASLLDKSSMRTLTEMATERDYQVWLEVVATEGVGVVIEDGSVVQRDAEGTDNG